MAEQLPRTPDQFDRELDFGWITKFMFVILIVTVLAFVAMWYMGVFLEGRLAAGDPERSPLLAPGETTMPPEPHLQTESYTDWAAMKAAHDHELATFGWVDRDADRVRVPVEEAMARIARDGLPDFSPTGDGTLTEATQ